ncbi:c-type cytochrome [Paraliomyxa miuraensis]|uniref:c-type cytochrome n=1 Tax=Paraliomyxa miuraensis TaxID=376150 RepID=UPI002250FB58|nr:hypothetical protein [Paraliomyxa miuraensis]MCX4245639.1 hypothetical protein [Paraliomyxa miuraensis]
MIRARAALLLVVGLGGPSPACDGERDPSSSERPAGATTPRASSSSPSHDVADRSPDTDPAAEPWSDAWLLQEAERYLDDRAFRRAALQSSLTNPENLYSHARLQSYGRTEGGWDVLPEWVPVAAPVTDDVQRALQAGADPSLAAATPLWDGRRPTTMAQWIELGRRVFFEYPLRPEIFAEHALAKPAIAAEVGLARAPDGTWPGVVVFRDLDRRARVGITCALCHVAAASNEAPWIAGAARRTLDYGRMRLRFHQDTGAPLPERLAERMAQWGPGRADITQDDDEDPVAIPDLWGVRDRPFLTQAGTLRHEHPAALAIRQETQILQANRERTRPPRELAWALAMYVYALEPPPRDSLPRDDRAAAGRVSFERHCKGCHSDRTGSGAPVPAERIGTDQTLAFGRARGTGTYRPSPLVRVADAAPYLHHGVVPTLEDLLDPARLRPDYDRGAHGPGAVPGHAYGTDLPAEDRGALVSYLRTL